MNNTDTGKLIYELRKERGMTQLQLAELMNISDKTVSKWERGLGCPDVSLLHALSEIFNVDLSALISGRITPNNTLNGSIKNLKIYICPNCGNILTSLAETSIFCCGKKLSPSEMVKAEPTERLNTERIENDYYISSDHEMTKEHYISFVALLSGDSFMIRKQYPEWNLQLRIPAFARGKLIWYCTQHGLFYQYI